MAINPKSLEIKKDNLHEVMRGVKALTGYSVLVGVPEDQAARGGGEMSNAALAYIHENGSPVRNIPPRPFLGPGIESVHERTEALFRQAAQAALAGDQNGVDNRLQAVGITAQTGVKNYMVQGSFLPLKPATIAAREARGNMSDKPLLDTRQLFQAISYVVRKDA